MTPCVHYMHVIRPSEAKKTNHCLFSSAAIFSFTSVASLPFVAKPVSRVCWGQSTARHACKHKERKAISQQYRQKVTLAGSADLGM